jgi:UDP-glucose 4-epimerase
VKICVTGGAGFIGAATIAYAEKLGHEAWRFDRADGDDILTGDLDKMKGADRIIHLAGSLGTSELFDRPHHAVKANVNGALRVLDWCRDNDAGYVGITMPDSSWANVYQATKLCAMRLATAWHKNFGVPVAHVRAFNAYGPGQKHGPGHPQKIVPTFATSAWAGVPIPIWGNGEQTVDLVHVDDVARILVEACSYGHDEVFDAGTGEDLSVNNLAGMINLWCGQHPRNVMYYPMRPGEEPETRIRAQGDGWKLLGWHPKNELWRIKEVVDFYKESV